MTDYFTKAQAEDLITEEKAFIASSRARDGRTDWYGLALSGGGIRSAIFGLGALQALAAKNVMPSFDYMSTVSGGGYVAAALQWLWRNDPATGSSEAGFPFGATREYRCGEDAKDKRLAYLRSHGQYLIPDEHLSIWSLSAVVTRTLFLNLSVWLPIGALAYIVMMLLSRLLEKIPYIDKLPNLLAFVMASRWRNDCEGDALAICKGAAETAAAAASAAHIPGGAQICTAATSLAAKAMQPACFWKLDLFFEICLVAAMLWIARFALWAIGFSIDTRISPKQDVTPNPRLRLLCGALSLFCGLVFLRLTLWFLFTNEPVLDPFSFAVGILFLVFAYLAGVLYRLQKANRTVSANYNWRRLFEVKAGWSLPWITILIALGTIPVIPYLLINKAGFAVKAGAAVASLASGLYAAVFGHQAQASQSAPTDLSRWILMVASAIFIYSIAVVAYAIAQFWLDPNFLLDSSDAELASNLIRAGITAWVCVALLMASFTNINYVGLHRFYRDRLMEAFMPSDDAVRRNVIDFSPFADRLSIADLWPPPRNPATPAQPRDIPYPIVNTNVIMMNDSDRLLSWRGGDNFIVSPLFVGSAATGWERTRNYISKNGPISVPSAVAASGAAINANAAYVGAGVTRDRLVSIVLVLLNLRLGMWATRPDDHGPGRLKREPNHWSPGFRYGLTRSGYRSDSTFVELTDGGHFDNSGIYELVRRKCAVIVAIDGEEDPSMALPALYSVVQRVREDFKAKIDLNGVLDELIPEKGKGYPEGVSFVTRPYFVAPITYDGGSSGVLIYVKLSLAQGLGFDALGYRAQHTDFPHQPTLDQFFVPEQVEAYRSVGFLNMDKAIGELNLGPGHIDTNAVVTAYQNRPQPQPPAQPSPPATPARPNP
ncbi:patatin-like phospholipase family protein [Bradyrhizobium manausense]|uniref:patatin-like phospholipase family protein n=1 Tax=Bradyrhizobium manausense TaxID=989370 RepID=UPI001BA52F6A|nr:patatin-like phospholipase family protein [Bradyrhizobium manausense]MBR1092112.1 patatin-like phospholipase family protein [Bradyrhizobium manausense]